MPKIEAEIAEKLQEIINPVPDYEFLDDLGTPKECQREHLLWMCKQITNHHDDWSIGKLNRWIGYIQGVLTSIGLTSVTEQRDLIRTVQAKYEES